MQEKSIEFYQRSELYSYVDTSDRFMKLAKQVAVEESLTPVFPIGIVIVRDGVVVAKGANGNGYHEKNLNSEFHIKGCKRRYLSKKLEEAGKPKLKSGEKFEICPGCDYKVHAEVKAIEKVSDKSILKDAVVYMFGHWWSCFNCWEVMNSVGIKEVCVVEDFEDKQFQIKWREEFTKLKSTKLQKQKQTQF